jgi:transcription elongation GreA/GreB family factor
MRDRRSKFVELANKRVNRAIKDLRLIGNLSNRAAYEFGEDDSRKIIRTLQKEVETLRRRFSGTNEEADKVFSL